MNKHARAGLLEDLDARGLIHDITERSALEARLAQGPLTVYCGFDPTADSLHVGNLVPLLLLRRFQLFGHRPIALAGGATGMVGDPSGRSEERRLLDDATLAGNLDQIVPQLRRFLDFEPGPTQARLHDNRSWTLAMSVLDFLRDVGKYVTVNQMLSRESVKARLASTNGISYTEFSYMLLQANDFMQLHELEGCEMQVGGSDQWGNIIAGVDLIRRRSGSAAYALTAPLLTRPDGSKYGKTASGEQLWLGAHRLSPYRFYQGWIQVEDVDVAKLLAQLTLLDMTEVADIAAEHLLQPGRRTGQRRLAFEVTALVHGQQAAKDAARASAVLFGDSPVDAPLATLEMLRSEVPTWSVGRERLASGMDAIDALLESDLATSRSDARRTLEQNGFVMNGARLEVGATLGVDSLLHGRFLLLRRGKANYRLVVVE